MVQFLLLPVPGNPLDNDPPSHQEPITRSIQLPCVRAMAFSQVGLFLDLEVFSVKISVSDDLWQQAYKIWKTNCWSSSIRPE